MINIIFGEVDCVDDFVDVWSNFIFIWYERMDSIKAYVKRSITKAKS